MKSAISPGERISRCVFLDNGTAEDVECPEGYMFMPDPVKSKEGARFETSVIVHGKQTEAQLEQPGLYIEKVRKSHPRYLGRCVCMVADVNAVNALFVDPSPSKVSEFHANILGWSNELARQILEAERLAAASEFVRRAS